MAIYHAKGLSSTPGCLFCNTAYEDVDHFLLQCPKYLLARENLRICLNTILLVISKVMDQSLFKFACNLSRHVFKPFSFISTHASRSHFVVNNNNNNWKVKPCLHQQSYFHTNTKYFCKTHENISNKLIENLSSESESTLSIEENSDNLPVSNVRPNVLEPPRNTDINFIAPQIKPTFNLAAYADRSDVLKHLIQLGVEIGVWDKNKEICANILNKDFENDIKPYIFFLHNHGVPVDKLGSFITRNPDIFEQSLENLQIRIKYLESRKFKKENIDFIINKAPKWLNYNIIDIDRQLGNFKKRFKLWNREVIELATRDPKLILYIVDSPFYIEVHVRTIEGQLGFTMSQQKDLLLGYPRIYRTSLANLIRRFDVIHDEMKLSHAMMAKNPKIFGLRERKLQERHRFLHFLGRAQYDPTKPGYVSPHNMVTGNDAEFSAKVAGSSVEIMNDFLKTL